MMIPQKLASAAIKNTVSAALVLGFLTVSQRDIAGSKSLAVEEQLCVKHTVLILLP